VLKIVSLTGIQNYDKFGYHYHSHLKMPFRDQIFNIKSDRDFNSLALEIFRYQYEYNPVYHDFVDYLKVNPSSVIDFRSIPFLPVTMFRTHRVITGNRDPVRIFLSSGTTDMRRSKHLIVDISIYEQSLLKCFERFYGDVSGYKILGLVPAPKENPDSSLGFMVQYLMEKAHPGESNIFLHDHSALQKKILSLRAKGQRIILIGLTSALIAFSELFQVTCPGLIIMETGGMKGMGKEMIREALHEILCDRFSVTDIHSEYGMTEILSQAYSKGNGLFSCPPWMKILIRDTNDPFTLIKAGQTGGINIIDLANFNSCSFIETQDLGKIYEDARFEVLGRFDYSDMRGCNLMVV